MRTDGASQARPDAGSGPVEYIAMVGLVGVIVLSLFTTSVPSAVTTGIENAVCRVGQLGLDKPCTVTTAGETPAPGPTGPSATPTLTPNVDDAKFQPDKCVLNSETTKKKTVVRILFVKLSANSEVKIQQWSDGTVTLDSTGTVQGGVEGGLDFPRVPWNGSASLTGGFTKGGGGGGRWLFDGHKTGDPQKDLEANYADAQQFVKFLEGAAKCNAAPPRAWGAELGMLCHHDNKDELPEVPPDREPDYDISKTTTEISGDVKFGKGLQKGGDGKSKGSLQTKGFQGTLMKDILVLRGNGEITFIYTLEINGRIGTGYQGEGSHLQQIFVTYNAADYDKEEKEKREHRPTRLRITTAERPMNGNPGVDLKASAQAGPFNVSIEGGGGETKSTVHTEVADLKLDNPGDSKIVEDWLRKDSGDGDGALHTIHNAGIPSPHSAAGSLPENPTDMERLLHDKGQLSSLDYNVDIDWWKAGFVLSLGVGLHKLSTGFKLFGIEYSEEHEEQTLTGNPLYAGAPRPDGDRPWLPFTKCSDITPV